MKLETVLRWSAIGIALAAVIDPAVTARRRVDAVVAVVTADTLDAALARGVRRRLEGTFTVVAEPLPVAAATVIVGTNPPSDPGHGGGRTFAVVADLPEPRIAAVAVPARAPLHARVPIDVALEGAVDAEVRLQRGDVVLDRATAAGARGRVHVPLAFVPAQPGVEALRVAVGDVAADVLVDVRETRWSVLFYDPRPSWQSTFVRRALEQDPRFVVTSRTVTSREIATEFGRPPRRLDDAPALTLYDVVVIGAPEALDAGAVAALERFLRRRGGGVVLLLDRRAGGAYERLAGVREWRGSADAPVVLTSAATEDSAALRATAVTWPASLPPLARPIAVRADAADAPPPVWRAPVGAGTLVVSGALDAWRFRDPETSGFDAFWRALVGDLAHAAPPALDAALTRDVVHPNERVLLTVTIRDAALADLAAGPVRATVSASLEDAPIALWPHAPGELRGAFRAPTTPGRHAIHVAGGDGSRVAVPLIVASDVARARTDERDLLRAWAVAGGGAAVTAADIDRLPALIERAVGVERSPDVWHPMRSAWWIVPFALALGGEWLLRRRRGLR